MASSFRDKAARFMVGDALDEGLRQARARDKELYKSLTQNQCKVYDNSKHWGFKFGNPTSVTKAQYTGSDVWIVLSTAWAMGIDWSKKDKQVMTQAMMFAQWLNQFWPGKLNDALKAGNYRKRVFFYNPMNFDFKERAKDPSFRLPNGKNTHLWELNFKAALKRAKQTGGLMVSCTGSVTESGYNTGTFKSFNDNPSAKMFGGSQDIEAAMAGCYGLPVRFLKINEWNKMPRGWPNPMKWLGAMPWYMETCHDILWHLTGRRPTRKMMEECLPMGLFGPQAAGEFNAAMGVLNSRSMNLKQPPSANATGNLKKKFGIDKGPLAA